jgi:hypothetical protein
MMQRLKHVAIPLVIFAYGIDAHAVGGLAAHHNFPSTTGATSMEVSITVEAEPPSTSGYFWAQQFWVDASVDHGGYFGLQTGGVIGSDNVGKMIIFSIWNATSAVAGPGAVAQTFGGEGIGYSVRLAYPWQEGVAYRFRLEKESALGWRVSVTSLDLGTRYLGTIQVTQNVPLRNVFAAFTEYFRNVPGCSSLPETRASFSPVTYGATVSLSNNPHAYGTCETWARAYRKGNNVVHDVAMLFANGFD